MIISIKVSALRPQELPVKLNNEHSFKLHLKHDDQHQSICTETTGTPGETKHSLELHAKKAFPVLISIISVWTNTTTGHFILQHHLTLRFSIIFQCPTLFVFIFVAKRWQSPEQDPTLPKRTIDINYQCQLIFIFT